MNRIGIIYICTGPYNLFWEDFYNSFEKYFLQNMEKHYYIFTDKDTLSGIDNDRIHVYRINHLPWPLITLLRFQTFLSISDELRENKYIMYSNSNIVCEAAVTEEEFLPRNDRGERLFVTGHPGYYNKPVYMAPYDRNKQSLAYVPYNCGKHYVIGAMNGGFTEDFLHMSEVLLYRTEEDLKKNIIARWHDESHLNRYIIGRKDYRLLSPSYCYPVGISYDGPRKICGVSKQAKFDVNTFKGVYTPDNQSYIKSGIKKVEKSIKQICPPEEIFHIRDSIMKKRVDVIV